MRARAATVTALRDSALLRLTHTRFLQFGERNPKVILTGDQVTGELTPYDLTKGRIIYRGR